MQQASQAGSIDARVGCCVGGGLVRFRHRSRKARRMKHGPALDVDSSAPLTHSLKPAKPGPQSLSLLLSVRKLKCGPPGLSLKLEQVSLQKSGKEWKALTSHCACSFDKHAEHVLNSSTRTLSQLLLHQKGKQNPKVFKPAQLITCSAASSGFLDPLSHCGYNT